MSGGTSPATGFQSVFDPLGAGSSRGGRSKVLSGNALAPSWDSAKHDQLALYPIRYALNPNSQGTGIRLGLTIGKRLRHFRTTLGLTQKQLATEMDLERGETVSEWELEKGEPQRGALRLAADLSKDSRRVFRWLVNGGPIPPIVSISSEEPAEAERIYTEAIIALGSRYGVTGMVPLPEVTQWLSRIRDAVGGGEPTQSGEDGGERAAGP